MDTQKNGKLDHLEPNDGQSCWVVFLISGDDIHPDLVSKTLDMQADKSQIPSHNTTGEWQLSSKLRASETVEMHIRQLLGILLPIRLKLRDIRKQSRLEFYCSIEQKDKNSSLVEIAPQLLLMIGHIGAELRVEFRSITDEK